MPQLPDTRHTQPHATDSSKPSRPPRQSQQQQQLQQLQQQQQWPRLRLPRPQRQQSDPRLPLPPTTPAPCRAAAPAPVPPELPCSASANHAPLPRTDSAPKQFTTHNLISTTHGHAHTSEPQCPNPKINPNLHRRHQHTSPILNPVNPPPTPSPGTPTASISPAPSAATAAPEPLAPSGSPTKNSRKSPTTSENPSAKSASSTPASSAAKSHSPNSPTGTAPSLTRGLENAPSIKPAPSSAAHGPSGIPTSPAPKHGKRSAIPAPAPVQALFSASNRSRNEPPGSICSESSGLTGKKPAAFAEFPLFPQKMLFNHADKPHRIQSCAVSARPIQTSVPYLR